MIGTCGTDVIGAIDAGVPIGATEDTGAATGIDADAIIDDGDICGGGCEPVGSCMDDICVDDGMIPGVIGVNSDGIDVVDVLIAFDLESVASIGTDTGTLVGGNVAFAAGTDGCLVDIVGVGADAADVGVKTIVGSVVGTGTAVVVLILAVFVVAGVNAAFVC